MEKISVTTEDQLLDFLDGKLSEPALQKLKSELEKSQALRTRLEELKVVHESFLHTRLETPSVNFTRKVMQSLHRIPATSSLSPRNGLLLVVGMVLAAGLLVAIVNGGLFNSVNGVIPLDQIPTKDYFQQQTLPTININGKLMIKILVGLNLILAFLVLDRTVLKPFFQRRAGMQL